MDALLVDDTSYRVHPRIVKNLGLNTHTPFTCKASSYNQREYLHDR